MPRTALEVVLCLGIFASCAGCAGGHKDPQDSREAKQMSIQEAKQVVSEISTAGGFGEGSGGAPPASIAEVREIVRTDQLGRFDAARTYAARLTGVDALALRASLEALWADALLTVADLFDEVSLRRQSDLRTLEATRETHEPEEADRLIAERKQQIAEADHRVRALRTLARPYLEAASELAREAQRQAPEAVVGYLPGAHASLLQREWNDFDLQIRKAEKLASEPTPYLLYLRALERAMRFGQRIEARRLLEELVAQHPGLSRARARLVLLEDEPIARHAQLEQLERHSAKHPIVLLAGPAIDREYVVSAELQASAAQSQPPAQSQDESPDAAKSPKSPDAPGNPNVYDAMQAAPEGEQAAPE